MPASFAAYISVPHPKQCALPGTMLEKELFTASKLLFLIFGDVNIIFNS